MTSNKQTSQCKKQQEMKCRYGGKTNRIWNIWVLQTRNQRTGLLPLALLGKWITKAKNHTRIQGFWRKYKWYFKRFFHLEISEYLANSFTSCRERKELQVSPEKLQGIRGGAEVDIQMGQKGRSLSRMMPEACVLAMCTSIMQSRVQRTCSALGCWEATQESHPYCSGTFYLTTSRHSSSFPSLCLYCSCKMGI